MIEQQPRGAFEWPGIPPRDHDILQAIPEGGACSKDICLAVAMDAGNFTKRVARLIRKGLVERHPYYADKRFSMFVKAGDKVTNEPTPDPRTL